MKDIFWGKKNHSTDTVQCVEIDINLLSLVTDKNGTLH